MKRPEESGSDYLIWCLFKDAWPVWTAHQGRVPDEALRQLEERGDWPRGLADAVMQRISSDPDLRRQLQER